MDQIAPPILRPRRTGWTPARQAAFLRELIVSRCVTYAAAAAGMSRESAYRLRGRAPSGPFALGWDMAIGSLVPDMRERVTGAIHAAPDQSHHRAQGHIEGHRGHVEVHTGHTGHHADGHQIHAQGHTKASNLPSDHSELIAAIDRASSSKIGLCRGHVRTRSHTDGHTDVGTVPGKNAPVRPPCPSAPRK